ncbi:MAG: hypothetical protein WA786_11315 [Acidimicrobiales bacterium]
MDDVVAYMATRASPDVAATLTWLDENEFSVAKQTGGSAEPFGNAQVEYRREDLGVRITKDRGEWILDLAPKGFDFMNIDQLLTVKNASEHKSDSDDEANWTSALPQLISWIEAEDRTEALEGARESWRVTVRQYWASFNPAPEP